MWVKAHTQMEVLNPIYMAPNMTAITRMTLIFILHCITNMILLIGCFHKKNETLVNRVQDMSRKVITSGVLIRFGNREYSPKYVGNSHIYQPPESNCFIADRAIGQTKHCSMYEHIYLRIFWRLLTYSYSGAVYPNIPHSPPLCSMVNKVAQYFKFLTFFLDAIGVTIMMSTSKPWRHIYNLFVILKKSI